MKKPNEIWIAGAIIAAVVALAAWWVLRPRGTSQDFADSMYRARYDEAAEMLVPPSALRLESDGSLILVDRSGVTTAVPAGNLPFQSGGGAPDGPGDFSMTGLGASTNGTLDSPAVMMYLKRDGGRVHIERVDF